MTRRPAAWLVLLAAAALPLAAPAATKAPARHATQDWTRTFAVTPEGGFRMGNPAAKIAIVEYGSLTCPHCRHFAQTGVGPLIQKYVRTGKASYEYRSLILNGIDLAATLVARCDGPSRFFPVAATLYAKQPVWVGKVESLPEAEKDKLQGLPPAEMMAKVAEITGIVPVAAANGIPPERAQQCLKDEAAANKLAQMYQAAMDLGVQGTPAFFVNGKLVSAIDWPSLEPLLKRAGG